MILALALSPSLDITYEVDALRHGEITRPVAVTRVAGGKALNVARVAHALGGDVHAIAAVGGHTGAWVAELLAADGVATTIVPLQRATRVCSAIVESGSATSSTDLYEPATPLTAREWTDFRGAALGEVSDGASWVSISGSLPDGVQAAEVASLLAHIRQAGARVAVDSSGGGLKAMAGDSDLIKINRAEASELLEEAMPDAMTAARALSERWSAGVVVTDGTRAGAAILGGIAYDLEAPAAPGRFPAGSGDAFLGGLLTGLDSEPDPESALKLARTAAERNARVPGQGVLDERTMRR